MPAQHVSAVLEKAEERQLEHARAPPSPAAAAMDGPNPSATLERRLLWKLDLILTPLFFVVFLITFIDRANIGNARVAGLERDLGLTGYQFNIALTVFYIFYALWEMCSNSVCKYIGARVWIPLQVFAFGLVCMCTGFVKNFSQLIGLRILLGIAEGGVLPAQSLVLSRFYKRDEMVFRLSILVSAAALAGAFGGLLASGFIAAGEVGSLGGAWRNIFVFEGIITIVISGITAALSASGPQDAWWLTAEEKELCLRRVGRDVSVSGTNEKSDRGAVWRYLCTPAPWICAFGYLAANVGVQGASLFTPTIVRSMYPGMTTVQIQLRSVPPFAAIWAFMVGLGLASTLLKRRGVLLLFAAPFAVVGYAVFVGTDMSDTSARYAMLFLNGIGAFPGGPMWIAWGVGCAATDTERSVASGLVPGWGQLGAIIATWCYLPTDAPNYYTGNSMVLGFAALQVVLAALMLWFVKRENALRLAGKRDYRLGELDSLSSDAEKVSSRGESDAEAAEKVRRLGSQHPAWLFPL
ncbi:uncharacterized protein JCM10292_000365 [Rhodotorula paludigena]|uniref:uncharacterized protein n=1 Tax=Rhodotorula paludigena TaxID=86838 RepID=UPI0031785DE7